VASVRKVCCPHNKEKGEGNKHNRRSYPQVSLDNLIT